MLTYICVGYPAPAMYDAGVLAPDTVSLALLDALPTLGGLPRGLVYVNGWCESPVPPLDALDCALPKFNFGNFRLLPRNQQGNTHRKTLRYCAKKASITELSVRCNTESL